jgi:hypothetical protein
MKLQLKILKSPNKPLQDTLFLTPLINLGVLEFFLYFKYCIPPICFLHPKYNTVTDVLKAFLGSGSVNAFQIAAVDDVSNKGMV